MSIFSTPIQRILRSYIKKIEGLDHIPRTGGFILAANHNNQLDSFILTALIEYHFNRRARFLSRKDIMAWRIIGERGAKRLNAILIDQKKKGESLEIALDALQQGDIIGIYPEGHLNDKPMLLSPRSGTARLALWSGLPVVPAGISEGPGANHGFQLLKDILFSFKHSTKIKFGKPLQFEKYGEKLIPKEILNQTTDRIMNAIALLCGKTHEPLTPRG